MNTVLLAVIVTLLVILIALHFRRGPAVRALFIFHGAHCMKTIAPGASAIASIQALDAGGNVVDSGPVTFVDFASPFLTITNNGDNTATYTVAAGTLPQTLPARATFQNVIGDTIEVNDSIVVSAPVDAAVSGSFVWTDLAPPAAKQK